MKIRPLIKEREIRERIKSLAEEIDEVFGEETLTVVCVLKGALIFTADLIKNLKTPVILEFAKVKSYEGKEKGENLVLLEPKEYISDRNILIVDDIFDTGETLKVLIDRIERLNPKTVKTCVLLNKKVKKRVRFKPNFVGFNIPDKFVVGYGLDYNENYRNLPFIGYIESS